MGLIAFEIALYLAAALPYVECASDGFQSASGTCAAARDRTGSAFPVYLHSYMAPICGSS